MPVTAADFNKVYVPHVEPAMVESTTLLSIRLAKYPDGTVRTQGAYQWIQGFNGGVTWKDMPVVLVDEQGQEITNG